MGKPSVGRNLALSPIPKITALQVGCLNVAIAAIFTAESQTLMERPGLLLQLLPPILLFFLINFIAAQKLVDLGVSLPTNKQGA